MKDFLFKTEARTIGYLSHHPKAYAFIVGIGVVLFWRGVWHSVDMIHSFFIFFQNNPTIDGFDFVWWDGLLSLVLGCLILYFTGAFTSSFIGNELILSGLRGEKKLSQRTEGEVRNEVRAIADIKDELKTITEKLDELDKIVQEKNLK